MSPPLLSICIPTYNRSRRLDTLLKALALQVSAPEIAARVEIIISDNASSDATQKVGEKWAVQHSFIHYFRNPWNIGGDPNQLRALTRGTGKFAWVLGDDDKVSEDAIERVLTYLKPGITQLFLDFRCFTVDGECLASSRLPPEIPDDITTIELIKRIGYVTVYSLISSHVFDREKVLAVDPLSMLKISPWYILCMVLITAFHDQKCVLVRDPVLDYTAGNDRLPSETSLYVRVVGLIQTFAALEQNGKITSDFLFGAYETGAGNRWTLANHPHYLREELYASLGEFAGYWALPGRRDARLIRNMIDRGPGFWDMRGRLKHYFLDDFNAYTKHKKPVIHFWRGKAWFPGFSILFSSEEIREAEAFDRLMSEWPEEFAHESIFISHIPEDDLSLPNIDIFMAPFRPHREASAALNSGFRKTLAPRVLVLNDVCSDAMLKVIKKIDEWDARKNAPASCLLFESVAPEGGLPKGLLGLYLQREEFVFLGGFENGFKHWPRERVLVDAAFRLGAQGWAMDGGEISPPALASWLSGQLPFWLRFSRRIHPQPFSEHGLNITERHHLAAVRNWHLNNLP